MNIDQINQELDAIQAKISDVNVSYQDVRQAEMALIKINSIVSRMTGSPDVKNAIAWVNRLIMTVRMLQIAIGTLEATTPLGMIYAFATWLGLAMTVGETALEMTS